MVERKLGLIIGGVLLLIDLAFALYTRMPGTRISSNSGWDLVCIGVFILAVFVMSWGVNARVKRQSRRLKANSPIAFFFDEPYGMGIMIHAMEDEDALPTDAIILSCLKRLSVDKRVFVDAWWADRDAFDKIRISEWIEHPKQKNKCFCEVELSECNRINVSGVKSLL